MKGELSNEKVLFLSQLVKALEESELKLEEYYNKKDYENFNIAKNFMLTILNKISRVVK